jgi:hypothetical protein
VDLPLEVDTRQSSRERRRYAYQPRLRLALRTWLKTTNL